jgi:thioredoxin-like negative regulator of GroEL
MAPVVHGLEAKYYGQIKFSYLDVDDPLNDPFKDQFGFRYQPMFVLLDGAGNPVKTWFGAVPAADFEAEFANVIQ